MDFSISENLIRKHCMGPNPITLLKWNLNGVSINKNSTVLDLGSGKGLTAAFLANVYDCNVFAFDKWISSDDAYAAISECSPNRWPIPLHGDARELPFPSNYFDAIISTDSFIYFGTDDLYIPYISQFITLFLYKQKAFQLFRSNRAGFNSRKQGKIGHSRQWGV